MALMFSALWLLWEQRDSVLRRSTFEFLDTLPLYFPTWVFIFHGSLTPMLMCLGGYFATEKYPLLNDLHAMCLFLRQGCHFQRVMIQVRAWCLSAEFKIIYAEPPPEAAAEHAAWKDFFMAMYAGRFAHK